MDKKTRKLLSDISDAEKELKVVRRNLGFGIFCIIVLFCLLGLAISIATTTASIGIGSVAVTAGCVLATLVLGAGFATASAALGAGIFQWAGSEPQKLEKAQREYEEYILDEPDPPKRVTPEPMVRPTYTDLEPRVRSMPTELVQFGYIEEGHISTHYLETCPTCRETIVGISETNAKALLAKHFKDRHAVLKGKKNVHGDFYA